MIEQGFCTLATCKHEMETPTYTFSKEERLCSKLLIDKLFAGGKTVYSFPYRFVYTLTDVDDTKFPIKVVFSVPKRNFKKAVDRNLLRRRIREAYRLEKHLFYNQLDTNGKNVALMIIYTNKEIADYNTLHKTLIKGMKKLISNILQ
jgi:ribonuclease P protein component